ncbi:DEAD/DEAH box helicase family protein [Pseudoalteromonas sp. MB41]|uniref:DEAD/DEAH box helicase n=1 Tax=unclassified Pseudoalteromonas TaxID=194690 RepID=UPI0015D557AD|nr:MULTISPECIES: DEAD/DEAH box helicase family protein [unclassified Pseudoalteromonas]MCC9659511.1 DEAD/DEAH box helicase family protein [Pseudoalteromonas sp. MB41]QLJ07458.1 DEAD/DEAH box helicase family protein [Pseudoalteromonas sp. JSTW]
MNVSGFIVNEDLWQSLRYCQQESIQTALSYLKKPLNENANSCLISLPTGAGKSGVIGIISHKATQKRVLVLCHRRAVCDQLFKEINGKFFRDRVEGEVIKLKTVYSDVNDTSKNGVYVSTFQKLQTFDNAQLELLKQNIDLIIIDEGHAEPSPVWSTLVRGIKAHKVVITATPYRNDLYQFDVTEDASYIYTFERALADGVLKEPTFESIALSELSGTITEFLKANDGTKCIIKCEKFEDIKSYYDLLNDGFSVLAIHEQFTKDERDNVKVSVPANLKGSDYQVIIHQRKLDEGVDIPEAKLLVLAYAVNSGRELVQTIGRVVRLYGDIEPKILEIENDANSQMWQNYRRFDRSLNTTESVKKFIASLDSNKLVERYLEAFPDVSYYGNRFVSKFDLNTFEPKSSLNIPTASICFLNQSQGFNVQLLSDHLYWRCNNAGELARTFSTESGIHGVISIAFNKSRFLTDQFFFEPSLEITLCKQLSNNIVAIYDSRGRRFNGEKDLKLGSAVSLDKLLKVMSLGESASTKEASSKSISSARKRPESIAVKGRNLEQMADMQANASYRLATMRCDTYDQFNKKKGSYYVGADSGRISDQKESSFTLDDLNDWLIGIDNVISANIDINNALVHSYAKPIPVNKSFEVQSLIFDFFTGLVSPISILIDGESYLLDNSFIYLIYDNGALLIDGIEESRVLANFKQEEPYLEIVSEAEILYSLEGEEYQEITDFLNKHLHKALLADGVSFSNGKFYQLTLPVAESFELVDSNLANVVIGLESLTGENLDEKGYQNGVLQVVDGGFSSDSIFYLVDQLKANGLANPTKNELGPFAPYIPDADLLINTDMGTEPADFIVSSKNKLAFVHVKCRSAITPRSSAGALAEVGSQAIKNIEMLISSDVNLKPSNWNSLYTAWPRPNDNPNIPERIRIFQGARFTAQNEQERLEKLDELWSTVAARRRSTAVKKEIWVVVANGFSAEHFEQQLKLGSEANGETLQAFQLLNSWLATAHNNDVELKVFVSP